MRTKLFRAPHKYIQSENCLLSFCEETKELGDKFLFICSRSANRTMRPLAEQSFEEAGSKATRHYEVFGGVSSLGEIAKFRKMVQDEGINVIVGSGGGSAIDTAKATAYYEHLPVVIVPTVCATDAACTGLSVLYNDDHTFNSYIFYPKNPDVVMVDSGIIAKAPVKFLVSGMGDALGTYFEARVCSSNDSPSLENGGIMRSAMALCECCYETLLQYGLQAKIACENNLVTPPLDAIIEANTYLSGVGADNGGLCVSHSVYNGLTALDELKVDHGDCVAYGTLAQLILEAAPKDEYEEVLDFCKEVGLPTTLEDLGITDPSRIMIAAEKATVEGESIHNMPGDVTAEQLCSAMLAVDAYSKQYFA